ncbi:MAG: hypothetical protein EGR46_02850 [Ruminococcus sp.]|uniref:hypothetical protein n=1 Tax=Ruminococcus sp. TaxID=41978 RepID=UPI0025F51CC9|nr:hypothetical protein [Ruminococcus sp.]MBD9047871.1 hypothetical protein [Ruminococcus sp.]
MDLLLEMIFDLILDGTLEQMANRKVPLILRIFLLILLLSAYGALIILLVAVAITFWKRGDIIYLILVSTIGIFISVFLIYAIIKNVKKQREK